MSIYWTRPNLQDEFNTFEEAEESINEDFQQSLFDQGAGVGEYEDTEEVWLYNFDKDEIVQVADVQLYAEFTRSDYEEHGTYWGKP